jgi:CheY-like chemotaxis protein
MSFVGAGSSRRYTRRDVLLAEDVARRVAVAIDNAHLFNSLKVADRQKDEFLAMLAHELRNPLAAISYAAQVVRLPDVESKDELFALVERQVQNLSRLIDDLLDISRISRDRIELRREHVDASTLARRAAATVRHLVQEKCHQLAVEIADEPMPLYADATRTEQIISNLLTNAAKYTSHGGQITVSAWPEDGDVVFRITDTGVGIAPDMLPRVFDLFAQADKTLDRTQGGLGIGLTVARKLVEMHGGTIAANSQGVGHGSEFTVRLPLSDASSPAPEAAAGTAVLPSAPLRLLVVDDNRDMAHTEALLLKAHGHEVQVAHDGPAAIELAHHFRPHAIFLDIGLPGMNGYDVAKTLREQGFTQESLIAVSGYGRLDDRDRSRRAGFDAHLVKPVDNQALLEILHEIGNRTLS